MQMVCKNTITDIGGLYNDAVIVFNQSTREVQTETGDIVMSPPGSDENFVFTGMTCTIESMPVELDPVFSFVAYTGLWIAAFAMITFTMNKILK